MNKIKSLLTTVALTVLVVFFIGSAGLVAQEFDNKPVADEMIGSGGITWVPKVNYRQLVLTISRADGTVFSKTIESGATPYAELSEIFGSSYADGFYTYELRVIPEVKKRVRTDAGDRADGFPTFGSKSENGVPQKALTQSGTFLVKGGAIVTPVGAESESSGSLSGTFSTTAPAGLDSTSDQVILDDLIVDGSACVGADCTNGESFGFDTLRLKENNLRIKFQDTSNSGSFPSNDWQLTANDSSNGGANKFSIDDIDGGKTPFTIEASAPNHSLYVDDGGRVGFGTSTPVVDLHAVTGNTPTLRLEQDGSSGFTPQTWDVAGNETNFFVRDVTNSSKLPFRIRPGAPSSSIDIAADGDVGIGTGSPNAPLHVKDAAGAASTVLELENNGPAKLRLNNSTSDYWDLNASANGLRMNANGSASVSFRLDTNGDVTIAGSLTTGTSTVYPDYVFESDYQLMPLEDLAEYIKKEKHLPRIPKAAEVSKKGLNITELQVKLLEKVEELTLYTLSQQETINALKNKIAELEKK